MILILAIIASLVVSASHILAQHAPDLVWRTNAPGGQIWALAFSLDSAVLMSGDYYGNVRVRRASDGELLYTMSVRNESFTSLTASSNNLVAGGGGSGTLRVWNYATGTLVRTLDYADDYGAWPTISLSSDGTRLVGVGRYVGLWTLPAGQELAAFGNLVPANEVAFSHGEQTFATGGADEVKIWPAVEGVSENSALATFLEDAGSVVSVAYLPGDTEIVSANDNGTVVIRRISDGLERLRTSTGHSIAKLYVASDGKSFATTGALELYSFCPTLIQFWRASDGRLLESYDQDTGCALGFALSPDGRYFAYGQGASHWRGDPFGSPTSKQPRAKSSSAGRAGSVPTRFRSARV